MNHQALRQSIIKTVAYFDIFEYPVTMVELYKWRYKHTQSLTLSELQQVLAALVIEGVLECFSGFYFMHGKQQHVETRLRRYRIAEYKFKRAIRAAAYMRWIPFVLLVGVCNNVGYNNCRRDSDIDFFIVTRHGRLWVVRLMVTILLQGLRLRRHGRYDRDRICLSFYVTESAADLSTIALQPEDPYLAYWMATMVPIYERNGYYRTFLTTNAWEKSVVPGMLPYRTALRRSVRDQWLSVRVSNGIARFIDIAGRRWIEVLAKKIQWPKLYAYFGELLEKKNAQVIVSDTMLKFHKTDRRAAYFQRWQTNVNEYTIKSVW